MRFPIKSHLERFRGWYSVVISTGAGQLYRPAQWRDVQFCQYCLYTFKKPNILYKAVILSEAHSPKPKAPCILLVAACKYAVPTLITLAILFCLTVQALGQGCAQCLDSTRATPPAVQAAYRHAIILLGSAGATLFIAGTLLLRRQR
jgi:hypothetical protein